MNEYSDDSRQIITALKGSGVVYMPTDTIPGLICSASSETAVEKIFLLKRRDINKPLTIIVSSIEQITRLGVVMPPQKVIDEYWPGPVSLVLPLVDPAGSTYLHRSKNSLAIRLTSSTALQDLINLTGPICTSSANPQGKKPAFSVNQARKYFGKNVDLYVKSDSKKTRPSSIVSFDKYFNPITLR